MKRRLTTYLYFFLGCAGMAAMIAGSAMIFRGCEEINKADAENNARYHAQDEASLAACTKANGIIIRSAWTNMIVDCKILPVAK